MECKFCNNKFSTKYSLKHHQENAIYCNKIRSDIADGIVNGIKTCSYCSSSYDAKKLHSCWQFYAQK